jgi:hypothetical protein
MSKLILEDVINFLPHGLFFYNIETKSQWGTLSVAINSIVIQSSETPKTPQCPIRVVIPISNPGPYKVLVRPLSDLDKEIEINGERFIPIEKLRSIFSDRLQFDSDGFYNHELRSVVNNGGDKPFPFNQLEAYRYLFKWHFDVDGLIEKGLAYNINLL